MERTSLKMLAPAGFHAARLCARKRRGLSKAFQVQKLPGQNGYSQGVQQCDQTPTALLTPTVTPRSYGNDHSGAAVSRLSKAITQ